MGTSSIHLQSGFRSTTHLVMAEDLEGRGTHAISQVDDRDGRASRHSVGVNQAAP